MTLKICEGQNAQRKVFGVLQMNQILKKKKSILLHVEHVYKKDFHTETVGGVVQLPHL